MFIGGVRNLIDDITDADVVAERVPRLARHFDAVQDMRKAIEEAATVKMGSMAFGLTNDGNMMRVASIPQSVVGGVAQIAPETFSDRRLFYRWLNRHPEYRVGKQVTR